MARSVGTCGEGFFLTTTLSLSLSLSILMNLVSACICKTRLAEDCYHGQLLLEYWFQSRIPLHTKYSEKSWAVVEVP